MVVMWQENRKNNIDLNSRKRKNKDSFDSIKFHNNKKNDIKDKIIKNLDISKNNFFKNQNFNNIVEQSSTIILNSKNGFQKKIMIGNDNNKFDHETKIENLSKYEIVEVEKIINNIDKEKIDEHDLKKIFVDNAKQNSNDVLDLKNKDIINLVKNKKRNHKSKILNAVNIHEKELINSNVVLEKTIENKKIKQIKRRKHKFQNNSKTLVDEKKSENISTKNNDEIIKIKDVDLDLPINKNIKLDNVPKIKRKKQKVSKNKIKIIDFIQDIVLNPELKIEKEDLKDNILPKKLDDKQTLINKKKKHKNTKSKLKITIPANEKKLNSIKLNTNLDNIIKIDKKQKRNKKKISDIIQDEISIKSSVVDVSKINLISDESNNNTNENKIKDNVTKENIIVNLSKKEIINRDLKRIHADYGITITIKDKALYNKIRTVIYIIGYEKLNDNFLFLLKKDPTLNIKDIYDIYKFEETIKTNFLTKILKIENIFNNALANYSGLDQKNRLNFSKKLKIFKDQEDKTKKKIISFINTKLDEDTFVEALYLAKDVRNRISHNQYLIKFLYQNKKYELKKIIESLNSISGEEKNFKDVVNKVINEKIQKLLDYKI